MSEIERNPARTNEAVPTTHPVDVLMQDHQIILAVLDAMERAESRLAHGEPLESEFWQRCVGFVENFADRCHHGKEEDLLFPALVDAGVPREGGPIGVMMAEHDEGRALESSIQRALEDNRVDDLRDAARSLVRFLRAHIEKEDNILFPMARELLPADQAEQLIEQFHGFERDTTADGAHRDFPQLARDLCAEMSVPFEQQRGQRWSGGSGCCRHS